MSNSVSKKEASSPFCLDKFQGSHAFGMVYFRCITLL